MELHGSLFGSLGQLAADQADHEKQNDRAYDRSQNTGKVETGDALRAEELLHDPTPKKRADDADDDVGDGSHLPVLSHHDACDPASDGSKDDPYNDIHFYLRGILDICSFDFYYTAD